MTEPYCPEEKYENCGWKAEAERLRESLRQANLIIADTAPKAAEIDGVAREALQTILDMGCPLGRDGDKLAYAQRVASEAITELNRALRSSGSAAQNQECGMGPCSGCDARQDEPCNLRVAWDPVGGVCDRQREQAERSPQDKDHDEDC